MRNGQKMNRIKLFFSASPRDLAMQKLTLNDIVNKMQKDEARPVHFPAEFAQKVSHLLEEASNTNDITHEIETIKDSR